MSKGVRIFLLQLELKYLINNEQSNELCRQLICVPAGIIDENAVCLDVRGCCVCGMMNAVAYEVDRDRRESHDFQS